jgi:lipopolysaccharide export system permease protein
MIKKIDRYILRVYIAPFLLIFSVLFFMLMSVFIWAELEKVLGKGLGFWTILKLFFLLGLTVVQIALPITVLWSSIMAMGNLGENYELSALKASGIPLYRTMLPIFVLTIFMSIGLYFFLDRITPSTQKKARNMFYELTQKKPTLSFREGVFINGIPGFRIKVNDIYGENDEYLKDIFIHKDANNDEDNHTIIAKNGIFAPAEDSRYLKLQLFNGYVYENKMKGLSDPEKDSQKNQAVKFDTLIQYFDISALFANDSHNYQAYNHFKFFNNNKLKKVIDSMRVANSKEIQNLSKSTYTSFIIPVTTNRNENKAKPKFDLSKLNSKTKKMLHESVKQFIENEKMNALAKTNHLKEKQKELSRITFHYNTNHSFPISCIVFFLIGSSLGAIIRKGGIAVPFLVSSFVFLIFWILNLVGDNLSLTGRINPSFGPWLGIMVLSPLSLFFTYKAVTDSALFNIENYLNPFRNLVAKFIKTKEHQRYQ